MKRACVYQRASVPPRSIADEHQDRREKMQGPLSVLAVAKAASGITQPPGSFFPPTREARAAIGQLVGQLAEFGVARVHSENM